MKNLSNANAKGRRDTAGCPKLAVFFLFCLFVFCGCPADASGSAEVQIPFVSFGKIYSFAPASYAGQDLALKSYDSLPQPTSFARECVAQSQKQGWILAWNKDTNYLYHIDGSKKVRAKVSASGKKAYLNKDYLLIQNDSFAPNKGFNFKLYSIKYSSGSKKISLKQLWTGYIDCFYSDIFFTKDGACIAGGTQDNTKNNVFYITDKCIHKCFSTEKKSDFLRILNTGDKVYAFASVRDESLVDPVIYSFTLDSYIEGKDSASRIDLSKDSKLPQDYECFFGYGFVAQAGPDLAESLVLPAIIKGSISFISYDYESGKITSVIEDAVGCQGAVGKTDQGTWYIARDALSDKSFYGISLFTGSECKKIKEIY